MKWWKLAQYTHVREVPHPHQTPLTRSRELFNQLNYLIGGVALIGVPWQRFHVMLPVTAFGCLVILFLCHAYHDTGLWWDGTGR